MTLGAESALAAGGTAALATALATALTGTLRCFLALGLLLDAVLLPKKAVKGSCRFLDWLAVFLAALVMVNCCFGQFSASMDKSGETDRDLMSFRKRLEISIRKVLGANRSIQKP